MAIKIDLDNLVKDNNSLNVGTGELLTTINNIKSSIESSLNKSIGELFSFQLNLDELIPTDLLNLLQSNNLFSLDLSGSMVELDKISKTFGLDYSQLVQDLQNQGVIVQGRTASGLRTVASAVSTTAPSRNGVESGMRQEASTSEVPASGARPGRTAGTRVYCANPDPKQVPKQNIIDALDQMCKQLDIYVQITPQGGWTGRASGTQNHPLGDAADFQIKQNDGLIYPNSHPEIYGKVVEALKNNANGKGVRPGIGGYSRFIHYDESPWRQSAYPISKVGFWNSGFDLEKYIS